MTEQLDTRTTIRRPDLYRVQVLIVVVGLLLELGTAWQRQTISLINAADP